jgi:hypothetical protein
MSRSATPRRYLREVSKRQNNGSYAIQPTRKQLRHANITAQLLQELRIIRSHSARICQTGWENAGIPTCG